MFQAGVWADSIMMSILGLWPHPMGKIAVVRKRVLSGIATRARIIIFFPRFVASSTGETIAFFRERVFPPQGASVGGGPR